MSRRSARRLAPDVFYRAVESIRAAEDDDRTYEFVVATEAPVRVGYGPPEVLRMSGCKLRRFKKNPVVLDSHGDGIRSILGTAEWRIEGRKSIGRIRLDETPEGDAAKARLDSGSLRTASIGYRVNWAKARELRDGDHDGAGDGRVEGPAVVQREWEPHEITLCPVPADEDAVRRRAFASNAGRGRKDRSMRFSDLPGSQPADELDVDDAELDIDEGKAPPPPPPAPKKRAAAKPKDDAPRAVRALEDVKRHALAFTPKGLEHVVETALLNGVEDVEEIRALVKKAHAKRMKPLGTPEPEEPEAGAETETDEDKAERAITPEAVERALKGLRS